jgi:NDP-sugar pyrophosphorylase family protein
VVETDDRRILSIREKPMKHCFVNAGMYFLNPEVLEHVPDGRFFDMPDLFRILIERGENALSFPIREYWLDIGRHDELDRANREYYDVFGG